MAEKIANTTRPTAKISKRLPIDYCLSENDVYIGRNNLYRLRPGNLRFNDLVHANLQRYCNATNRREKTAIINDVVDQVRANSIDGGFVKRCKQTGQWYEVGDIVAREKTSQAIRDATIGIYKSSRTTRQNRILDESISSNADSSLPISSTPSDETAVLVPFWSNPTSYNIDSNRYISNWQSISIAEATSTSQRIHDRILPPVARSNSTFDDVYNIHGNTIKHAQSEFPLEQSAKEKSDDRKLTPFELRTIQSRNTNIMGSQLALYGSVQSNNDNNNAEEAYANRYEHLYGLSQDRLSVVPTDLHPMPIRESMMISKNAPSVGAEPTTAVASTQQPAAAAFVTEKSDEETFDLLFKLFPPR